MSETLSVIKVNSIRDLARQQQIANNPNLQTLIVPAVIALLVFLLVSYVLVPMWQRYRNRYSQYLPIDRISSGPALLRQRFQGGIVGAFMPSILRRRYERVVVATDNASEADFNSEDGEELEVVNDSTREQHEREAQRPDVERRISRE